MTHRGLFYCAEDPCTLGPEVWREINGKMFGLCLKHAVAAGWIAETPEIKQALRPKRKSFLTRLLEGIKNGTIDDVIDEAIPRMARKSFPSTEPLPHWSESREYPF